MATIIKPEKWQQQPRGNVALRDGWYGLILPSNPTYTVVGTLDHVSGIGNARVIRSQGSIGNYAKSGSLLDLEFSYVCIGGGGVGSTTDIIYEGRGSGRHLRQYGNNNLSFYGIQGDGQFEVSGLTTGTRYIAVYSRLNNTANGSFASVINRGNLLTNSAASSDKSSYYSTYYASESIGACALGYESVVSLANVSVELFVISDTVLSKSDQLEIAKAPYGEIFKPQQRRIWVPSVGGGGANTDSAANSGSVAITGSTASALRSLVGVASSGSIAITGVAAVGVKSSAANTDSAADFGIISITGSPAAALRALQAASSQGSITITGVEAAGVKAGAGNTDTAADSGSITITGFATNGIRTLTSAATAGSVVLTGSAASGAKTIFGTANSGSITITGSDATVARTYLGIAGSGSVVITGSSAVGAKSGTISLSAADIQAIVDALMSDPRMLTLPKWIALR